MDAAWRNIGARNHTYRRTFNSHRDALSPTVRKYERQLGNPISLREMDNEQIIAGMIKEGLGMKCWR